MPRGPLPTANPRRRNTPSHPGKALPPAGRAGRPPNPPLELGEAGQKWWRWAWSTPQATAWDRGCLYAAAHRAQLEDDLSAMHAVDTEWDFARLFAEDPGKAEKDIKWLIGQLRAMAGDRVKTTKAMNDLDDRLGLSAKAAAQLRWKVDEDEEAEPEQKATVRRLKVADAG